MEKFTSKIQSISNLTSYLKIQNNQELILSDVLELVPYRFEWIKKLFLSRQNNKIDQFYDQFSQIFISSKDNIFLNLTNIYTMIPMFDQISILELGVLTKEEDRVLTDYITKVRYFNLANFLEIREDLYQIRDAYTSAIGREDPTYNEVYKRVSSKVIRPPVKEDLYRLQAIGDLIDTCDFLIANKSTFNKDFDPFSIVREQIENSLPLKSSNSGFLVRFKRYDTLQTLAKQYLGDPERWGEIAIANGLQPPYIDLDGEDIPVLSDGHTNKLTVSSKYSDRFEVGSRVFLFSKFFYPQQKKIQEIKVVNDSEILILSLDGDRDLDKFRVIDGFKIKVFKTNTVNEYFEIIIPSDKQDDNNLQSLSEWLESAPAIVKNAGTDILLTKSGDIAITESADLGLSQGYENLVQAVQLILSTEKGALFHHSDYGIVSEVGNKYLNGAAHKKAISENIVKAIEKDPRFVKVTLVSVSEIPHTKSTGETAIGFELSLSILIAGVTSPIPIKFRL